MLMPTPPSAPTAPIRPMDAPDSRRPWATAASPSRPLASALAWKMPGIILNVEPLPSPLSTNRTTNTDTNSGSDFCMLATMSTAVAAAMPT